MKSRRVILDGLPHHSPAACTIDHDDDAVRAKAFQQARLRRGLILELGGRHGATVRLLPPLVISEDEVDFVATILTEACAAG